MVEAGDELAAILAECLERHQRGEVVDRQALLDRHPELANRLRSCFTLSDFIDEAADELGSDLVEEMPETIDEYRLIREIGRGGMGVVYEAIQVPMDRPVALKVLSRALGRSKEAVQRFRREVRVAGRLHHPNIVPIYATGRYEGLGYYAMELVEGMPLRQVLIEWSTGDPAPEKVGSEPSASDLLGVAPDDPEYFQRMAGLFAGVAEALDLAHSQGIVHRDVKPSNILLDTNGILRVVDFGLAQLGQGGGLTLTGMLLGTPTYMSPEQAVARQQAIDHRTDVYSLGATLYETLTLEPPYRGDSAQEICARIVTEDLPPPRRLNSAIPSDLETIVLKAMEKDRSRRYATAGELAADLRRFVRGAEVRARRPSPLGRWWQRLRRRPMAVAAVALVLVALVLGWGLLSGWGRATSESAPTANAKLASELKRIQAEELAAKGSRDLAIGIWHEAIALDPDNELAYLQLADHLRALRHFDEGLAVSDALVALKASPLGHYRRATILRRQGRLQEALDASNRAIQLQGRDLGFHRQRVRLLLLLDRYEDALGACREGLDLRTNAAKLRQLEILTLRLLDRDEEAVERAAAAVKDSLSHKHPHYRAYVQAAAGLSDDARKTLQTIRAEYRPFLTAMVYAVLGDEENLRHWLEFASRETYGLTCDNTVYSLEIEPYAEDPTIDALLGKTLAHIPAGGNRRRK